MTQHHRRANLTAEAFVKWAMDQLSGRFELTHGEIVAMAPERVGHARSKKDVLIVLDAAVVAAGLSCEVFGDGMAIRVDDRTVYEPDAAIRCGPRLSDDVVLYDDPVVVVEIVSPSSRGIDTGAKLAGYFRLPSVRHYLVVEPQARRVIHHRRAGEGGIATRILDAGDTLALDPPGIEVRLEAFYASL